MPTVPALQNIMKFQDFFKVHQISSNFQNLLESSSEHACEIWAHSEKLTYFKEKCRQCRPFEIWNFNIFIQNSPNFIKLAEFIEIIIRNMHVKFQPIQKS